MRLHVYLPDELVAHVDRVRGDVPRSKVVQRALEAALKENGDRGRSSEASAPSRAGEAAVSPRAPSANFGAVRRPYVKPFKPQPKS